MRATEGASTAYDLVINRAVIREGAPPVDIGIRDGVIAAVGEVGAEGIDAAGQLVLPGFVNSHTHLDKVDLLTRMRPDQFGYTLEENRVLLREFKAGYTVEEIAERALGVIRSMVQQGITGIRTQVDVDPTAGLTPLDALLRLKAECAQYVTLQLCAFPQEGVVNSDARALVERALERGADLLGGLPLVERTPEDRERHVDLLFSLAKAYDVDLEVQVDQSNNPRDFVLPYLARKTIAEGYDIVTPSCNLITRFPEDVQGRGYNSIVRVKDLLAGGVPVALGTDNVRDIFYPLGNGSMIREMHVLATTTRMSGVGEVDEIARMAAVNGAKLLGLGYGVAVGKVADLIVTAAGSTRELINTTPVLPYVVKGGRVVARTVLSSESAF
jgi:cytosine deaminase